LGENRPEDGFNDGRNELKIVRKQSSTPQKAKESKEKKDFGDKKIFKASEKSSISALSSMFIDYLQKSLFYRPSNFNDLLLFIVQILNRDLKLSTSEPEVRQEDVFKNLLNSPQKCFHFAYLVQSSTLFFFAHFSIVVSLSPNHCLNPAGTLRILCLDSRKYYYKFHERT